MTTYNTTPSKATDRPEWTAAKAVGDDAELRVAEFFKTLGLLVNQQHGHATFDLGVTGRIEVKRDLLAERTGNVAVEVEYRGRPSGITNSIASAWAFIVGTELLLLPTAKLRELVRSGNFSRVAAGESAVVVLVPLNDLRRSARRVMLSEEGTR